ncbi:aminodeoxychorismate synthase component I [Dokdonella sp.]|uniref:aminodeoxychorismate synthase component I n=1 Tax=Dokdonella sp. TaxID=2291710 RepID=UPI0035291633
MPGPTRIIRVLKGRRDLLALAAAHPQRYPGLLESAADGTLQARHDILFGFPQSSLQLDSQGRVRDSAGNMDGTKFLDALDCAWQRGTTTAADGDSALPFHGGWLIYLGYELAGEIEPRLKLPAAPGNLPVALALHCPLAAIVDHESDRTHLVAEAGFAHLLDQMEADMQDFPDLPESSLEVASIEEDDPEIFMRAVERIHEYLRDGDVFQVNLSRQWRIELARTTAPAAIYERLRRANPAPFAGLLQWNNWAVVSSSPERLVQTRGDRVQTRPIAGTRPRLQGEDSAARIRELIGHPKERAEHVMLIDLERNDLGRVCVPGSVVVDELMGVESYAHVHHIVSNVSGRLRPGTTPGQVIRAVFPGGTITGCPKVRCMEIIAELEHSARGAFTGAVGYLDNNGNLDLNILIRTLTVEGRHVSLRAGAGIVVDSDAQAEVAETRDKARGLLRAFGIDG